jgi:probable phosphoglycerate mutase
MTVIWFARHGESVGNVAAQRAESTGAESLALDLRDADVPLTDVGFEQAEALGAWLGEQGIRPTVWSSPYLRARETARIACEHADLAVDITLDERLRDRELGVLDLLTSSGVQARFPDEAARRLRLGKFWYRPPGGESWADVAFRARSVLTEIRLAEGPTLIVAHDVVVTLCVYVLCRMTDAEILALARGQVVGNATVTTLVGDGDGWRLESYGDTRHLHTGAAPVTAHHPDDHADVL